MQPYMYNMTLNNNQPWSYIHILDFTPLELSLVMMNSSNPPQMKPSTQGTRMSKGTQSTLAVMAKDDGFFFL